MKNLVKSIKALNVDEKINFEYNLKTYVISCFFISRKGDKTYSVYKNNSIVFDGMNVEKITQKYITLYSYDMMGNKTTYKMSIEKIKLI